MKRLIAVLAASILLVTLIASYDTRNGTRSDGLYYQVCGIRPDAQMVRVNGEAVSAEEYLYWLASVCEYLYSYSGGALDFDAQITADMTYGEYAKRDALETVKLYAVTRQWAKEVGVTLTAEDLSALEQQRAQYIGYYGSEEAYLQQVALLGVTEELLRSIDETPLLYNRIYEQFCDESSSLYPGDAALQSFAKEKGYVTAQLLYFSTAGLDETAKADALAKAQSYAAQMQQAADKNAMYETLAAQLGITTDPAGLTFEPSTSDAAVCQAVAALEVGQSSGVIEGANGYYVALLMDLNYKSLTEDLFNIRLQERIDSAKVDSGRKLYTNLDAGDFYTRLNEARTLLLAELAQQAQSPANG